MGAEREIVAKFKMGGSGPDGRGLGRIRGIVGRRFVRSGEIFETDDFDEIQILRRCPYVEEVSIDFAGSDQLQTSLSLEEDGHTYSRNALERMKMRELIKIGRGLYRVGLTKAQLIDMILSKDYRIWEYSDHSR